MYLILAFGIPFKQIRTVMLLHVQVSNREFHLCIGKQNYHVIVQYPVPDIDNVNKTTLPLARLTHTKIVSHTRLT